MALTASAMLPLGTKAPTFKLPDTISGKVLSLAELASDKGTVVMFICNHCPYVLYLLKKIITVACDYQAKGIQFIAISANDVANYPEDSPEKMQQLAAKEKFPFPYLYDESQAVAKSYHAVCTPDFFVFDAQLHCVYRGRFDDSSPGKKEIPITGKDLTNALNNLLAKQPIAAEQLPSMGCNIKWK